MTQEYYATHVLPVHIQEVLRDRKEVGDYGYQGDCLLQEDNDPSHGTRSEVNVARELKDSYWIATLYHPGQSCDLNPGEAVWNIMKARLRGRRFRSEEDFKRAVQAEYDAITLDEIRKRIAEMPWRCEQLRKTGGQFIKSELW